MKTNTVPLRNLVALIGLLFLLFTPFGLCVGDAARRRQSTFYIVISLWLLTAGVFVSWGLFRLVLGAVVLSARHSAGP